MIQVFSPAATALSVTLLLISGPASSDVIADALGDMSPNSWQRINSNTFQSVWTPLAQRPTPTSPMSNIAAWSGAAWDASRRNMYIWGGDHSSVGDEGNEVYIFSGNTGLWSRGSLPSQITSTNGIQHTVDGVMNAPLSGESWDNVVFLKNVDRMAVLGVSREGQTWRNPATGLYTGPYFWDPAKADPNKVGGLTGSQVNPGAFPDVVGGQMWQNRDRPMGAAFHLRGTSAYLDVNGNDVVYATDWDDFLYRYTVRDLDPTHDTWELIGRRPSNGERGSGAAAIDTTNNLYLHALSNSAFGFWDLDHPGGPNENREIKVVPEILSYSPVPGFENFGVQFDPILGAFMLWDGASSVWRLTPPDDLDSNDDGILDVASGWLLEELVVSGIGPQRPERPFYTGVYGKWIYLPEYNAYLGVIDPFSGDVFVYKPAAVVVTVPEPNALAALLIGLLGMMGVSRIKRNGSCAG